MVDADATACRLVGRLPAAVIARFTCESVMVDHSSVSFNFASTCACDIRLPVALTCVTAAMRASLIASAICAHGTARAHLRNDVWGTDLLTGCIFGRTTRRKLAS